MSMPIFTFKFGPNNAFFAQGPDGWIQDGYTVMEVATMRIVTPSFPQTSHGVAGTFATVTANGNVFHQLNGQYPMLEQALASRHTPVELITLNPYLPGSFLLVYKHGAGYLCRLPLAYQQRVIDFVCAGMLPMLQAAQLQQAQSGQFLLNTLMMNRFF